jgi:hypothetical protein
MMPGSTAYWRTTRVWVLLLAATALSWQLGHGLWALNPHDVGTLVIVIAFIKVRWIILDFMELRHAPLPIRAICEIWLVCITVTLITLYRT